MVTLHVCMSVVPFSVECDAIVTADTVEVMCVRRGGVLDTLTCVFDNSPAEDCKSSWL